MSATRPPLSRRSSLPLLALGGLLAVLVWAGCDRGAENSDDPSAAASRFGDPYEVVLGHNPADPDMPPALVDDSLRALIQYSGGCEDHDFALDYEVRGDTARLWLRHDASGDDCEALVADELRLPVPEEVHRAPAVVLLNPNADEPFLVRW